MEAGSVRVAAPADCRTPSVSRQDTSCAKDESVSSMTADPRSAEAVAEALADEEKMRCWAEECFDMCDADGDGHLTSLDLGRCLRHMCSSLGVGEAMEQDVTRYVGDVDCGGGSCGSAGSNRVSKQECKRIYQDLLLVACGGLLSFQEQTVVHLKALFNAIDLDGDGELSKLELASSSLVQRELPFLASEVREAEMVKGETGITFPTFEDLMIREAKGLIMVRMIRERFEAFARSRSSRGGQELCLTLTEAGDFIQQHLPDLEVVGLWTHLADLERTGVDIISCDDFVGNAVDMMDYLQHRLAQIIGLTGLKQKLVSFCRGAILDQKRLRVAGREGRHFKPARARHMILRGNPGSGKTMTARLVKDILLKAGLLRHDIFLTATREELVGAIIGATAKLTKEKVKQARGGVLFIDEAYRLYPKDADPKDFGREAVDELMAAMLEDDAPVMIFAGYPKLMDGFLLANPGLRSRVPTSLDFKDYSWSELAMILDQIVTRSGFAFAEGVKLPQVADVLRRVTPPGAAEAMNGRLCELVFEGAKQVLDARIDDWKEGDDTTRLFELSIDDLRDGCSNVPPPADAHLASALAQSDDEDGASQDGDGAAGDPTGARAWLRNQLDKLVGLEAIKEQICNFQQGMELDARRLGQGRRVKTQKVLHMIFAGNPGTGKTTVARLMAELLQKCGMLETRKLVDTTRDAFIGRGFVGSAEAATLEILESARGGVLFIDEANQLQDGSTGQKVLETLMQRMVRPEAPVMIFAGYPEEMARFELANKGLASRIPYRFSFPDFEAAGLAQILRTKVERSGFELAPEVDDEALEEAISELVPLEIRSMSNGRLCETAFKFAKERLDVDCVQDGELSSVIGLSHVREGIRRSAEWGPAMTTPKVAGGPGPGREFMPPMRGGGESDELRICVGVSPMEQRYYHSGSRKSLGQPRADSGEEFDQGYSRGREPPTPSRRQQRQAAEDTEVDGLGPAMYEADAEYYDDGPRQEAQLMDETFGEEDPGLREAARSMSRSSFPDVEPQGKAQQARKARPQPDRRRSEP